MDSSLNIEQQITRLQKSQARLKIAIALLALSLIIVVFFVLKQPAKKLTLDTLDVGRINILEPDGTIRLSISNRSSFPGLFIKNEEFKHPRNMAGLLFFNDEGTEQGGLIYKGQIAENGKPSSGLSLTFDRYQQDQQIQLLGVDENGTHFGGLSFNDVADGITRPVFSEKDEAENKSGNYAITRRVFLGKAPTQNSTLQLLDAQGKSRLELKVTPSGEARIIFLDAEGKITKEISN